MHYSPLRYPGGKGKIAPLMKDILVENHLLDGIYVEPYAGGAGIALGLLFQEYVRKIIINDIDRSIYAFWHSILNHTEEFCTLIQDTELTISEWNKQKTIQKRKDTADLIELGFSTFYLNRTNRSGIISGGVIGGNAQAGKWKMDARYNKLELIQRIQKISNYKNRIQVCNQDALDFIRDVVAPLPPNSLIYFDPPYFQKGQQLYVNHYNPSDHAHLRDVISNDEKHQWVLTYDNMPEILDLYSNYRLYRYTLTYSVANKGHGSELMFFSSNCVIPEKIELAIS